MAKTKKTTKTAKTTKEKVAKETKPMPVFARILIIIAALLAILALAFGVHYVDSRLNIPAPNNDKDKMAVSLEGEMVCLPHKGDGPHTLECTYGVRDDDGNHFGLIDTRPQQMPETDVRVKIDGVLVPVEENDEQPYDIKAYIRHARIKTLEE